MGLTEEKPESVHQTEDSLMDRWRYFFRLIMLLITLTPKEAAISLSVTAVSGLMPVLILFALRHLVDNTVSSFTSPDAANVITVFVWVLAVIVIFMIQECTRTYGEALLDHAQEKLKAEIQCSVMEKAQSIPLQSFEQPELFDQLQRVQRGLDQRLFSTMTFIFRILTGIVTAGSILLYFSMTHWMIPVMLAVGTAIFTMLRIRPRYEKYILQRKQTPEERRLDYLAQLMTGRASAMEIRLFGLESHLLNAWSNINTKLRSERLRHARREFQFDFGGMLGYIVTFGAILTFMVYLGTKETLTAGQYAALISAVIKFQDALTRLFWEVTLVNNDLRYIRDYFQYMDLPEERESGVELPKERLMQGIVFRNVAFRYPGSKEPVLKGINLHIRPGERIALIGENGAGKTTLVKLLLGLYQPTEGQILIDGIDIKKIHPVSLRNKSAAIFQDFQQYHLTVRENIALGKLESMYEDTKIRKAAELSGAADFVSTLPHAYETHLGKEFDGIDLSRGQWQKIAIARAYLRESDVLVLDEPTAALDPKAEVEVCEQFRDISRGRTVLLISHRLGAAKLADRIIVLHNGVIAEEGTHAELMSSRGYYAEMLSIQSQWYQN